jgi:hypothetical protein
VYAVKPFDPDPTPVPLIQPLEPKEAFVSAAWAPDGAYLYAVRRRPAPGRAYSVLTDVVRVDVATGERETLDLDASPSELAVSRDGVLALIGAPKGVPVGTVPDALYLVTGDGMSRLASADRAESNLQFLTLPRFSPDGRRLLFVAASPVASAMPSAVPAALTLPDATVAPGTVAPPNGAHSFTWHAGPKTVYAHGIPAAPWVADLDAGTVQPLVAGPFDDVAGLAWADNGRSALLLDASGLAQVSVSGAISRLAVLQASGLAWHDA